MVRSFADTLLSSVGYEVVLCEDGPTAIEYLRAHPDQIDLVILDLNLPVMSGDATFKALRALDAELPVIISTGFGADVGDKLLAAGARAIVQKPFELEELTRTIARTIRPTNLNA